MFLENSRYHKLAQTNAAAKNGKFVKALKLRRLPRVSGLDIMIKQNDQLDIMAQRNYDDPTRFWHIADANTELEANNLTNEPGRIIKVPES